MSIFNSFGFFNFFDSFVLFDETRLSLILFDETSLVILLLFDFFNVLLFFFRLNGLGGFSLVGHDILFNLGLDNFLVFLEVDAVVHVFSFRLGDSA